MFLQLSSFLTQVWHLYLIIDCFSHCVQLNGPVISTLIFNFQEVFIKLYCSHLYGIYILRQIAFYIVCNNLSFQNHGSLSFSNPLFFIHFLVWPPKVSINDVCFESKRPTFQLGTTICLTKVSNNDVCAMLKIPTIFLEKIICGTTDLSTFSVLLFFTNQLSVSCHLLKRHFSRCEIYREVTVYSSCTCVLYQSLSLNILPAFFGLCYLPTATVLHLAP